MNRGIDSIAGVASAVLFAISLVILVVGVAVAAMTYQVAADQAARAMMGGMGEAAQRIARIQLLIGVRDALQAAAVSFGLGAIVAVLRRVSMQGVGQLD